MVSNVPPSRARWILFVAATAVLLGTGSARGQFYNCTTMCHTISGDVWDGGGGPLLSGHVYLVAPWLQVPAGQTLTINAGAVIKFVSGGAFYVAGTLSVNGTAAQPVIATSLGEDILGDHNGNGTNTLPQAGDWSGVLFSQGSSASQVNHFSVRYAGGSASAAIRFNAASPTLTNCYTNASASACLDLGNNSGPTITNAHLVGGTKVAIGVPLAAVPGFHNCLALYQTVATDIELGFYASTLSSGLTTVAVDNTMNQSGVLLVTTTYIVVYGGATLTLDAGVVLKFGPGLSLICSGILNTTGTPSSPAVLTSVHDDTYGGDSNLNGAATAAAPGQWADLLLNPTSDASNLQSLLVRCAGQGGASAVRFSQSNATANDLRTELCGGPCIDLLNTSAPQLSFCKLDGGTRAANNVTLGALAGFRSCTATGNTVANAPFVTSPLVNGGETAVIRAINTFNASGAIHLASAGMFVYAGGTLDVGPGVVFKFSPSMTANFYGTVHLRGSGHDPVVFTAITDDDFGGDSNADGPATAPAPGWWLGLAFEGGSTGVAGHVRARHGAGTAFRGSSASVSYDAIRVDSAAGHGLVLNAAAGTTLDNMVAWNCGLDGIRWSGTQTLRHATAADCGGAGIRTGAGGTGPGAAINCVSWGNGSGYAGFAAGAVTYSDGFAGGTGNLDLDPLFVNAAAGDLRLQAASPCVDAGDLATGFALVFDHDEGSRLSDGRLLGTPLADLGAYELAPYRLQVSGKPWSGTTISLQVSGPPGAVALGLGIPAAPEFYAPMGFLTASPLASIVLLGILPANAPFPLTLPDLTPVAGIAFGVQALGVPLAPPGVGAFTNLYRGVFDG